jgi:hypothetical protein
MRAADVIDVARVEVKRALRAGMIRVLLEDARKKPGLRALVAMTNQPQAVAMMNDVAAAARPKDKPKRNRARMELRFPNGATMRFRSMGGAEFRMTT